MKNKSFKIGDKIRIIKPEFFIRVGYPMTLKDAYGLINEDWNKLVSDIERGTPDYFSMTEKLRYQLRRELAYSYLKNKKFGGNERKLYTVEAGCSDVHYSEEYYTVLDKKTVKTGEYAEELLCDYEEQCHYYTRSFLRNQKTHTILYLDNYFWYENNTDQKSPYGDYFIHGTSATNAIEACNVLLYEDYIKPINHKNLAEKLMR